ncbi:hypothetical protein [Bacillus cereus]
MKVKGQWIYLYHGVNLKGNANHFFQAKQETRRLQSAFSRKLCGLFMF